MPLLLLSLFLLLFFVLVFICRPLDLSDVIKTGENCLHVERRVGGTTLAVKLSYMNIHGLERQVALDFQELHCVQRLTFQGSLYRCLYAYEKSIA